jgi:nucleoside-diphosphate-sugar epimerase
MLSPKHHILLLGGTGLCGTVFTHAALEAGHTLTLYVRTPSKIPSNISSNPNIHIIPGDFGDAEGLKKAAACGATVFVSLAGPTLGEKKGTVRSALSVSLSVISGPTPTWTRRGNHSWLTVNPASP